tara:strand:- start:411 stop:629 length:219 start_codon:yes stop_codon:yes gene_type:complete
MSDTKSRLIYMANQIARNFGALDADGAAEAVAEHITLYWDPRMKAAISGDEAGLSDVARAAFAILNCKGAAA